jgi:hypothetical protein
MRLIKTLGLAIIAAVAAMAFIGAPSASAEATALCKANELACSEKNTFPAGTTILLSLIEGLVETELGNIECEVAHAEGKTLNKLGSPLEIKMESATHEGCGPCSVTVSTFGTLLLLKTAANLGEIVAHGMLAKLNCGGVLNCNFVSGLPKLHAKGLSEGMAAMATGTNVELKSEGGFLCPKKTTVNALVNVTANGENFYISN